MTPTVVAAALLVLFLAYFPVIVYVVRTRQKLTCMTGMMIGMCVGMMVSLTAGFAAGVSLKISPAVSVGVIVGITAGALAGAPVSFMAALDGIMAGLMGGMMGAMLGVMTVNYDPMPMLRLLMTISVLMAAAVGWLIHSETKSGEDVRIRPLLTRAGALTIAGFFFYLMYFGLTGKEGGLSAGASAPPDIQAVRRVAVINEAGTFQEATLKVSDGRVDARNLVVRLGIPVKLVIEAQNPGCFDGFYAAGLGVSAPLANRQGLNEIVFTPGKPGDHAFSCSMGMVGGTVTVIQ